MASFDQRGQKVTYQYNSAGNINFGAAETGVDVTKELKKLLKEINKATQAGAIDSENGIDIEAKIKKAIIQAEKPQPDKQSILENINGAKTIIEGLASAVGLIGGFIQAIEMVRRVL
jgi:hypothetical protein